MNVLMMQCLLFVLAALITGFVTGSATELPALRRRFLIGSGIGVLLMLMLFGLAALNFAAIREFFQMKAIQKLQISASIPFPILLGSIPGYLLWILIAGGALLLFFLFLLAFNCRRREKNRYFACGWILLFGVLFSYTSVWGYYGLSTFILMARDYSPTYPGLAVGIAFFLLISILLTVWTYFALKHEKRGAKRLLVHAGMMTGVFAVCWLLGLGSAWIYGSCALAEARKQNIFPWYIEADFTPEQKIEWEKIDRFYREHEDFALPIDSVGYWRRRPGLKEQDLIPDHKRNYTLKWFDSPEFEALLTSYEKLQTTPRDKVNLASLNYARAYARVRIGRAALYSETGQPEKILPEFRKVAEIKLNAPEGMSSLVTALVDCAIQYMWAFTLVSIGPDGPEYAPFYREMQKRLQAYQVRIPNEAGYFIPTLEAGLHFRREPSTGRYTSFLSTPPKIAAMANGLRSTLSLQKLFSELERTEFFQIAPGLDPFPDDKESVKSAKILMLRSREMIALGTTGLALKRYRSEKGRYPEKLEQLVPEYLEKLPLCPSSRKPLFYESDGTNFALSSPNPNHKRIIGSSTEKNY